MRQFMTIHATALTALALISSNPAAAEGKGDRAKEAIAEAQGKIDALNAMGASGEVPRMTADAAAALRSAQDELSAGHKQEAIEAAHRASHTADTAMGVAQKERHDAAAARQADAAAAAQGQVAVAQDQAAAAQQQAAAANARAANAEQTAASAAADAASARAATTPAATTVTTETTNTTAAVPAKKRIIHRTVHRKTAARPATVTEKTTTTVTNQ